MTVALSASQPSAWSAGRGSGGSVSGTAQCLVERGTRLARLCKRHVGVARAHIPAFPREHNEYRARASVDRHLRARRLGQARARAEPCARGPRSARHQAMKSPHRRSIPPTVDSGNPHWHCAAHERTPRQSALAERPARTGPALAPRSARTHCGRIPTGRTTAGDWAGEKGGQVPLKRAARRGRDICRLQGIQFRTPFTGQEKHRVICRAGGKRQAANIAAPREYAAGNHSKSLKIDENQ